MIPVGLTVGFAGPRDTCGSCQRSLEDHVTSVGLPAVLGDHVIPVGLQRSLEERVTSVGLPAGFGGPCYTFWAASVPLRSALYLWGCQRAFEKSLTTKTRRKARIAMPKHHCANKNR